MYLSERILKRNILGHEGFDLQTEGIMVLHSGLVFSDRSVRDYVKPSM